MVGRQQKFFKKEFKILEHEFHGNRTLFKKIMNNLERSVRKTATYFDRDEFKLEPPSSYVQAAIYFALEKMKKKLKVKIKNDKNFDVMRNSIKSYFEFFMSQMFYMLYRRNLWESRIELANFLRIPDVEIDGHQFTAELMKSKSTLELKEIEIKRKSFENDDNVFCYYEDMYTDYKRLINENDLVHNNKNSDDQIRRFKMVCCAVSHWSKHRVDDVYEKWLKIDKDMCDPLVYLIEANETIENTLPIERNDLKACKYRRLHLEDAEYLGHVRKVETIIETENETESDTESETKNETDTETEKKKIEYLTTYNKSVVFKFLNDTCIKDQLSILK